MSGSESLQVFIIWLDIDCPWRSNCEEG